MTLETHDMIEHKQPRENREEVSASEDDPGFSSVQDYLLFSLSLPERTLRSASGVLSGTLRESASLLVPQAFRSSKTYEVFVQQMLDFMAEDVGGVKRASGPDANPQVENFVARKTVGNFIEMASLATVHLSPMTLLAIVSDVAYGSQAYLEELANELQEQGVIDDASTIHQVDDLLAAVAAASRTTASAFDTPPLSVDGLMETVQQTREALQAIDPTKVLPQSELERLWDDMHTLARREGVNPFAISGAMTLYSLEKVGHLGTGALSTVRVAGTLFDRHVINHYFEALEEINSKGMYNCLAESSRPYLRAVWRNFSSDRSTITEDLLSGKFVRRAWGTVRRWIGGSDTIQRDADSTSPGSAPPDPDKLDSPG
jgi:hypothetical protein